MDQIKQYSYPNVYQRKIILFNSLITFSILSYIVTKINVVLKSLFIYQPVFEYSLCFIFSAYFLGIIISKFIFTNLKNSRIIYIISEVIFIIFSLILLHDNYFLPENIDNIFEISQKHSYLLLLFIILFPFVIGFKTNYFQKTLCGTFFDEKKGIILHFLYILIGLLFGTILFYSIYFNVYFEYSGYLLILLLAPTLFLINLDYSPKPIFAQEIDYSNSKEKNSFENVEDIFFSYFNFSNIAIYLFLGYLTSVKYYGDFFDVKSYFLIISVASISIGYIIAQFFKRSFWHIYSETLYPFVFICFYLIVLSLNNSLTNIKGILFFIIPGITFGFTLFHTLKCISTNYTQKKAHSILLACIYLLPLTISIVLSILPHTNQFYYIIFYVIAIFNILFPGLYLLQRKESQIKKVAYSLLIFFSIPLFIFIHYYFDFNFNSESFINTIKIDHKTFSSVKSEKKISNYEFFFNNKIICSIDPQSTKNMNRAISTISLFSNYETENILFINGYNKFNSINSLNLFKKATFIDYVPGIESINPGNDRKEIIENELLLFLSKNESKFSTITDIPNLYDQQYNYFRFTENYYKILKNLLSNKEIFIQILDLNYCRKDFINSAISSFGTVFTNTCGFLYGDLLIMIGSNNKASLELSNENLKMVKNFINQNNNLKSLYYNEHHCLAYILFTKISNFTNKNTFYQTDPLFITKKEKSQLIIPKFLLTNFFTTHNLALNMINSEKNKAFEESLTSYFEKNNNILTLLKNAELAENKKNYSSETEFLFKLKDLARNNKSLYNYISNILIHKENSYYTTALFYENEKQWDIARKLYLAILSINEKNFDANYRLGILSITLQDIDSAFLYLQNALKLNKDNPEVLYQMGVLLYSNGRFKEALENLLRANYLKKEDASTYFYIGLCYQELKKWIDAKKYLKIALEKEPENQDIQFSVNRLNEIIDKLRDQWKMPERRNQIEEEIDEKIPLPINKSAIDKRLKDK